MTFLAALRQDRVEAPWVVNGPINGEAFRYGTDFQVVEAPIFEHGKGDWKDEQVQSPTVIEDEGQLKMWFAGESRKGGYHYSIGYASRKYP